MKPGQKLRAFRSQLGLSIREVEASSARLAAKHNNARYFIPASRLSDMETKNRAINLYRLYALAVIYRRDFREILAAYNIDLDGIVRDASVGRPLKTHEVTSLSNVETVQVPLASDGIDSAFAWKEGVLVEKWRTVPMMFLQDPEASYVCVGAHDLTMYPLIRPGAFVQIDRSKTDILGQPWQSDYDRPIYIVETRAGLTCCWCRRQGDQLILEGHPLSNTQPRSLREKYEAEIVGQVVAVAMRLDE